MTNNYQSKIAQFVIQLSLGFFVILSGQVQAEIKTPDGQANNDLFSSVLDSRVNR